MHTYLTTPHGTLHHGHALDVLRTLPEASVHCCVTSPPYWGLRDYGAERQIGAEDTMDDYLHNLLQVMEEVRRVLRVDGTLWLNLGDAYVSSSGKRKPFDPAGNKQGSNPASIAAPGSRTVEGIAPKNLMGIPWRVAFALQAAGWFLRCDIIWAKPNPMPESVQDRPTRAHEYLFLLSKSERYYYDHESVKEPAVHASDAPRNRWDTKDALIPGQKPQKRTGRDKGNAKTFCSGVYTEGKCFDNGAQCPRGSHGNKPNETGLRNRRSVWTVATRPFPGAHFATFPPELITPCILAGCPMGGVVLDPFFGSGTTGDVAQTYRRRWIGIELNPDYCALAARRVQGLSVRPAPPLGPLAELLPQMRSA